MLGTTRKYYLIFFLLCTASALYGQTRTELEGRVYSKDGDVAGTHIVNKTTQRATITGLNGFFSISVRLNDTLTFSAVQFKRKEIVVTEIILNAELLSVPLEEVLTELDEVVVTPYNLTGTLGKDVDKIKVEPIVTASTIGLRNRKIWQRPNGVGKVVKLGKYGRIVIGFDTIKLTPEIIPEIYLYQVWKELSGTNKALKRYADLEKENVLLEDLKQAYGTSFFAINLKIPEEKITDFMNYCAADTAFAEIIETDNIIGLWNFIKEKSITYRNNNGLNFNRFWHRFCLFLPNENCSMNNFKKFLILLILPLFAFASLHKFYVSVTNVNYSEKDTAIQITSRIFIDDFERLLKERYEIEAKLATENESKSANKFIEKYLRAKFVIEINGETVPYDFIGKKYDADVMICYIEAPEIDMAKIKSIQIENEILTDLFDEQQNVLHFKIDGKKKSFVLVKSDTKGMLKL